MLVLCFSVFHFRLLLYELIALCYYFVSLFSCFLFVLLEFVFKILFLLAQALDLLLLLLEIIVCAVSFLFKGLVPLPGILELVDVACPLLHHVVDGVESLLNVGVFGLEKVPN